jgi:ABC-type hemin transport system substrate-binding protein
MFEEAEAAAHVVGVVENVDGVMSTDRGASMFDEDSERMYVTVHGRAYGADVTEILAAVEADDQVYGADVTWAAPVS